VREIIAANAAFLLEAKSRGSGLGHECFSNPCVQLFAIRTEGGMMHSSTDLRRFFLAQVSLEGEGEACFLIAARGRIRGDKLCEIVLKSLLPSGIYRRGIPVNVSSIAVLRAISAREFEAARGTQANYALMPQLEFWSLKQ